MRDVLAVAAVALGLGGIAAYMSVDFTPPGLDLIRPQAPAVVQRIEREEKQRTIQAEAKGCKYCATVADLANTFSRRAETARTHATALKKALPQVSDQTDLMASRRDELKSAEVAADRAEAAAAVLTGWASRCSSEEFCKASPVHAANASCVTADDPRSAAAQLVALSVRKAAEACASAACPSVDCQATASLKGDMTRIEQTLDMAGAISSSTAAGEIPVGASTFKAELARVSDEAGYVAKMLPLLLDNAKAKGQLPKLAPAMIDERAVSASQLAGVMEQSAAVGDNKADPRYEAAWRLKSLAANLAAMGKDTQGAASGSVNWEKVADSVGAALLDLARLQAIADRAGSAASAPTCDGPAAVMQQLREARAMLDLCRMRSACIGRGGAGSIVKTSADSENIYERAQAAAQALQIDDLGGNELVQVGDQEPAAIDVLRTKGVCRRSGELREAKAAVPAATGAVAEAVVAPTLAATSVGTNVVSPQDLIAGASQAVLDGAPAEGDAADMTEGLVEAATRYSDSAPRFKPRRMQAADPELMQTAVPREQTPAQLQQRGIVLPGAGTPGAAFGGGEGGPTRTQPPGQASGSE